MEQPTNPTPDLPARHVTASALLAWRLNVALRSARRSLVEFDAALDAGLSNDDPDVTRWPAHWAGRMSEALRILLEALGALEASPAPAAPTPTSMDRRHPDGVTVGDPAPLGAIADEYDSLPQCRNHSPANLTGWTMRCHRLDHRTGQHLTVGRTSSDGTGDLVVTAVWPAGEGWASA